MLKLQDTSEGIGFSKIIVIAVPPVMKSDDGDMEMTLVKSDTVNVLNVLEISTPLFEIWSLLILGRRPV